MSGVRIKEKYKHRAHRLFDEMWADISPNAEGGFPYPEFFKFDNNLSLLNAMLEVNTTITAQEKSEIVLQCFQEIQRTNKKDFEAFIIAVKAKIDAMMAQPEKIFYLTATVSFRKEDIKPVLSGASGK